MRISAKLTHKPQQRPSSMVSMKVCFSGQQRLTCISLERCYSLWRIGRAICGQHGEPAGSGAIAGTHSPTAPSANPLHLHTPCWLNPLVGGFPSISSTYPYDSALRPQRVQPAPLGIGPRPTHQVLTFPLQPPVRPCVVGQAGVLGVGQQRVSALISTTLR